MTEQVVFNPITREKLVTLSGKAKTQHANCVITTEDDLVLTRHLSYDGADILRIPSLRVKDLKIIEEELIENPFFHQLLSMNAEVFREVVAIEFLGEYRIIPLKKRSLEIPVAVELDMHSSEIVLGSEHFNKWMAFDAAEQYILTHPIPANASSQITDGYKALQLYFDKMTDVEEVC